MPELNLFRKVLVVVDDMMNMRNIVTRALLLIGYLDIHDSLNGGEDLEKIKFGGFESWCCWIETCPS